MGDRTLFIDDNLAVLRAAGAYGIGHLLAVIHPDSTAGPVDPEEFSGLYAFEELNGFSTTRETATSAGAT